MTSTAPRIAVTSHEADVRDVWPRAPQRRWTGLDSALLVGVLLFAALWVRAHFLAGAPPIEDAAMLLRYAQHFAAGHGVRWNIDQPPVDGATDFLYMVATGALARVLHLGVFTASRVLNLGAHFLSVAAVFVGGRKLFGANRWVCAWLAMFLAASLATNMATGGFGAPFFAAMLLSCWMCGLIYVLHRASWTWAALCGTFALLSGLTRPEGVLTAVMMLAAFVWLARPREARVSAVPLVVSYALMLGVLGGAYFVWRWRYFGYPLPNPFYIKGDGHLYVDSVMHAAASELCMLGPVVAVIALSFAMRGVRRLATALLIVLVPFTLMWILLNNQNNHFMRFQYAIVPLTMFTATAFASELLEAIPRIEWTRLKMAVVFAAAAGALFVCVMYVGRLAPYANTANGMRQFALRLQPLASRGYTMVVTEAGDLPFYSQWRAIDALGLNDSYVAHHPHFGADYLDRFHPELIMVHMDAEFPYEFLNGFAMQPETIPGAYAQEELNAYAQAHGYTLAAAYGANPCNLHFYWLRPGFADYDEVLKDIRGYPYYFLDNGQLAYDYRDRLDTLKACALPRP